MKLLIYELTEKEHFGSFTFISSNIFFNNYLLKSVVDLCCDQTCGANNYMINQCIILKNLMSFVIPGY